jgi:hypothetical protein
MKEKQLRRAVALVCASHEHVSGCKTGWIGGLLFSVRKAYFSKTKKTE